MQMAFSAAMSCGLIEAYLPSVPNGTYLGLIQTQDDNLEQPQRHNGHHEHHEKTVETVVFAEPSCLLEAVIRA